MADIAKPQPVPTEEPDTPPAIGPSSSFDRIMNTAKEKWDKSGGPDAIKRVSDSIPEGTKAYMGSLFKPDHYRDYKTFLGIGESSPYTVELNATLLEDRLRFNARFFYLNYFLLTALLFCLTLIVSPGALVGILLLITGWLVFIRASSSGYLTVVGVSVPQKTAAMGMGLVSILILLWLLSNVFWWALFTAGIFVAFHLCLRNGTVHREVSDEPIRYDQ